MSQDTFKEAKRKTELQIRVQEDFVDVISRKYQNDCKRNGTQPTHEGLLYYMISHNLIDNQDINRYMTIEKYPEALYTCNGRKTRAMRELENEIPVGERTLWAWVGKFPRRYRKS